MATHPLDGARIEITVEMVAGGRRTRAGVWTISASEALTDERALWGVLSRALNESAASADMSGSQSLVQAHAQARNLHPTAPVVPALEAEVAALRREKEQLVQRIAELDAALAARREP